MSRAHARHEHSSLHPPEWAPLPFLWPGDKDAPVTSTLATWLLSPLTGYEKACKTKEKQFLKKHTAYLFLVRESSGCLLGQTK